MTAAHPWAARTASWTPLSPGGEVRLLRPVGGISFNSAFPYGEGDGPVWAGRGATSMVQAGVSARYGPVSLVLVRQRWNASATLEASLQLTLVAFSDVK